jgi:peptidoglycan/LPS O-acetylase OafA/YrhL
MNNFKYNKIDFLRAVAIISVIGFHYFPDIVQSGFLGVDLFIFISGLLITNKLELLSNEKNKFNFINQRLKRILPGLVFTIFFIIISFFSIFSKYEFEKLVKHAIASLSFIQNINLNNELGYFNNESNTKPLNHLWSLALEVQFYLVYFLIYFFNNSKIKIIIFIGFFSILLNIYFLYISKDIYFSFYSRFWEFSIGSLAFYIINKNKAILINNNNSVIDVLIIFFLFCLQISSNSFNIHPNIPSFLVAILFILHISNANVFFIYNNKLIIYISSISYQLFLFHWPILLYFQMVGVNNPVQPLLFTILFTIIYYHFIDRKFFINNSNWYGNLLISLTAMFIICFFVIYPSNINQPEIRYNNYDSNKYSEYKELKYFKKINSSIYCSQIFEIPFKECNVIDKNSIFVFGDSFISAAIDTVLISKINNISSTIYSNSGRCFSMPEYGPDICKNELDSILQFIQSNNIKHIILAPNWNNYYNGMQYGLDFSLHKETKFKFKDSLRMLINKLKILDVNIILFYSQPMGFNKLDCNFHLKRNLDKDNNFCIVNSANEHIAHGDYINFLDGISNEFNLKQFKPKDYLCLDGRCYGSYNGINLTTDGYHLSSYGSIYLSNLAKDEIINLFN